MASFRVDITRDSVLRGRTNDCSNSHEQHAMAATTVIGWIIGLTIPSALRDEFWAGFDPDIFLCVRSLCFTGREREENETSFHLFAL